jgi:hypothetical protein
MTTQDIPKANEQAYKNLLDDVEFVEREMRSLGLDESVVGLDEVFGEIKAVGRAYSRSLPTDLAHNTFPASRLH